MWSSPALLTLVRPGIIEVKQDWHQDFQNITALEHIEKKFLQKMKKNKNKKQNSKIKGRLEILKNTKRHLVLITHLPEKN